MNRSRSAFGALLLFGVAYLVCGAALAGPIQDATAAQLSSKPVAAVRIFTPLANAGNVDAQIGLASIYDDDVTIRQVQGDEVPVDIAMAVFWYRRAAEQGNATAQLNLGQYSMIGKGTPQDFVEAHKWFNLAAASVDTSLSRAVAEARRQRDILAKQMTKDQVAEAQRLAREWKAKPER